MESIKNHISYRSLFELTITIQKISQGAEIYLSVGVLWRSELALQLTRNYSSD